MKWRRRASADMDQAIRNVGWDKTPVPPLTRGGTGHKPGAGAERPSEAATPPAASPGTGHHRGSHMVIDTWQCGCIYTWTRPSGWTHDFNCITDAPFLTDADVQEFLRDQD